MGRRACPCKLQAPVEAMRRHGIPYSWSNRQLSATQSGCWELHSAPLPQWYELVATGHLSRACYSVLILHCYSLQPHISGSQHWLLQCLTWPCLFLYRWRQEGQKSRRLQRTCPEFPPFTFECKLWEGPRWSLLGCYLEAHVLFRLLLFTLKILHVLAGVLELSLSVMSLFNPSPVRSPPIGWASLWPACFGEFIWSVLHSILFVMSWMQKDCRPLLVRAGSASVSKKPRSCKHVCSHIIPRELTTGMSLAVIKIPLWDQPAALRLC